MSEESVYVGDSDAMEEVSLQDLAGFDLSGVEEYRQMGTPAGKYLFKITDAELSTYEIEDKKLGRKVPRAAIKVEMEVVNCFALVKDDLSEEALIGHKHPELFFIRDAMKSLGEFVAFVHDMGIETSGSINDVLNNIHGHEFIAAVKVNKNGYSNIDKSSVAPATEAAA